MTKTIAHRGAPSLAPENTISSFLCAIQTKAEFIELDVRETKDNILIVIHSHSLEIMTGYDKNVADLTYDEIRQFIANVPAKFNGQYLTEYIPKLSEVLALIKNKSKVAVELKSSGIELRVLELIKRKRMINSCVIIAKELSSLKLIRKNNTNIGLVYLAYELNEKLIDKLCREKINYLLVGWDGIISDEIVKYGNDKSVKIWKYTIDDVEEMKELINYKIDGIVTNYPQILQKIKTQHLTKA